MVATRRRMMLRGRFDNLFRKVDVLLTPTVAVITSAAGTIGAGKINGGDSALRLGPQRLADRPANRRALPVGGHRTFGRGRLRTRAVVGGCVAQFTSN
jgi:hypothetical protein